MTPERLAHIRGLEAENAALRAGCIQYARTISRIDYALGEPNEMECSLYDVDCDDERVIEQVITLRAENAALRVIVEGLNAWADSVGHEGLHVGCTSCLARDFLASHRNSADDKPTEDPPGTCDWGGCMHPAAHWLHSATQGWLPVCIPHSTVPLLPGADSDGGGS